MCLETRSLLKENDPSYTILAGVCSLFLLFFWLRHWGYVSFRTGKNDDICNPSGGASAGIYDGFSETQTDSQVSALTHLEFNGFLHYCYLMCLNLYQKKRKRKRFFEREDKILLTLTYFDLLAHLNLIPGSSHLIAFKTFTVMLVLKFCTSRLLVMKKICQAGKCL